MARKKLIVEEKAEALVAEVARLRRRIRYHCKASKHAAKSADAVLLNLGEGIVAFQPRAKAAAYNVARREAGEVMKAFRALIAKGKLAEADCAVALDLTDCIIAMLTNMIKNLEDRF